MTAVLLSMLGCQLHYECRLKSRDAGSPPWGSALHFRCSLFVPRDNKTAMMVLAVFQFVACCSPRQHDDFLQLQDSDRVHKYSDLDRRQVVFCAALPG